MVSRCHDTRVSSEPSRYASLRLLIPRSPSVRTLLQYCLAGLFACAATTKIIWRARFSAALADGAVMQAFGVATWPKLLSFAVPATEAGLAGALVLFADTSAIPAAAAILFLGLASLYIASDYTRTTAEPRSGCQCFSVREPKPVYTPSIEIRERTTQTVKRLTTPLWLCARNTILILAAAWLPGVHLASRSRTLPGLVPSAAVIATTVIGISRVKRLMKAGAQHEKAPYFLNRLAPLVFLDTYRWITPVAK